VAKEKRSCAYRKRQGVGNDSHTPAPGKSKQRETISGVKAVHRRKKGKKNFIKSRAGRGGGTCASCWDNGLTKGKNGPDGRHVTKYSCVGRARKRTQDKSTELTIAAYQKCVVGQA